MTAMTETLMAVGVFLVGLVARLGIVLGIGLLLMSPVLAWLGAARLYKAARLWAEGYRSAGPLRFRGGLNYAPGHTWVKEEGGSLKVGLDDLAQRLLPWTVAVEMPRVGREVEEGEAIATLSCGDREVRVAAPASGRVVKVNAAVLREPTLAKSENYGTGWLFAIEPAEGAWRKLPVGEAARSWLSAEGLRLERFYEEQLGMAAADGGEFVASPDTLLDDAQWKQLTRSFLGT